MESIYVLSLILLLQVIKQTTGTTCDTLQIAFETNEITPSSEWVNLGGYNTGSNPDCLKYMKEQVQLEIDASIVYLKMAAYFSRDNVNRPGFAKFFFESSNEEREHAIKFIEYMAMRGAPENFINLIDTNKTIEKEDKTEWKHGLDALNDALNLEIKVTQSIRNIVSTCEGEGSSNDYHAVDYLTGEFLEEQHKGQRQLAGMISTLNKMRSTQGAIADFLYDKKIIKGELF